MGAVAPPLPEGVTANARARELERELRLMGPINPLALEEFEELRTRNEFLESQLDDVKSTRRDLSKVIRAVDEEIVSVFEDLGHGVGTRTEPREITDGLAIAALVTAALAAAGSLTWFARIP